MQKNIYFCKFKILLFFRKAGKVAKFLLAAQNGVHLGVPSATVSFMLRQSCGSSKEKVFQNLQP